MEQRQQHLRLHAEFIGVCHNCAFSRKASAWRIECSKTGANIVDQAVNGCPAGFFDSTGLIAIEKPSHPAHSLYQTRVLRLRKLWGEAHRRPLVYRDRESELAWITKTLLPKLSCGDCRTDFSAYLASNPPALTSPRAYYLWTVEAHNHVSRKLNKPPMTPAHAARVHGLNSLMTPDELAGDVAPVRLLVRIAWSLGDEVVATAAIRDIHATYPGEYQISLDCRHPEVFAGLDVSTIPDSSAELIHDFKIHRSLATDRHFVAGTLADFETTLNRPLRHGPLKAHLVLTDEEKAAPPLVDGPYWVLAAGYKVDCTTKAISREQWQGVVDRLPDVQFVQVGGVGPTHVEQRLDGTTDLTGKTSVRDLVRLIASSDCLGVVSGITGVMHIGAAFDKPLVVVAGAREDDTVARYDNCEWIRTSPPCQNCWSLRAQPWAKMGIAGDDPYPGHDRNLCQIPDGQFASCITAITSERIVQGIERFRKSWRKPMALCTFYSTNWQAWASRTAAQMEKYARRHGYDFIRPEKPLDASRQPRWQKPEILLRDLPRYEYMAWLDADIVLVNHAFDLLGFIKSQPVADLYLTNDMNGMNNGSMIWRNTPASFDFLRRWQAAWQKGLCDQVALGRVLKEPGLNVCYVPQTAINSYWWNCEESHFLCHLVGGKGKASAPLITAFLEEFEV